MLAQLGTKTKSPAVQQQDPLDPSDNWAEGLVNEAAALMAGATFEARHDPRQGRVWRPWMPPTGRLPVVRQRKAGHRMTTELLDGFATSNPGVEAVPEPRFSPSELANILGEKNHPTPEQAAIIASPPLSPRLVIAGAGSGKTATMADRVVWLVANGWVRPEEVLGVTFTRKAAGELASRIRSKLATLQRIAVADDGSIGFPEGLLGGRRPRTQSVHVPLLCKRHRV